ncbi:lysylphosphatidylglycerol synthase domain-containing protein [Geminicoccus roseus]|uniref:lysylphosphatidylglycerol synthase domain-containing protein n=1 Tax=Geminicoccus roseus TaxID=404900 RepID=UPI000405E660|nr:lysylphosphatidylglycerol synthase domain-containing protein [Geminicoccus roseus]
MQSSTATLDDREAPPDRQGTSSRKRWITAGVTVAALSLASFLLYRTFSKFTWDELVSSVAEVPTTHLLWAAAAAAASYVCLTGFDWMAVRYAGHRLPYRKVALTSFLALSIGHTVGMAAFSSGMIRYRFYSRWGLSTEEVAKVVLFCGVTVGIGMITLGGAGLLVRPDLGERITGFSQTWMMALGAACLVAAAGYLALAAYVRRPLHLWRWSFQMPSFRLAIGQVVIGTLNFTLVAACLHQALSAVSDMPYLGVAAIFVIANITTMISHVPGGLGVIESVVLYLMPGDGVIGGLIAFRCIYFFIPLAIGGVSFALTEIALRARGHPSRRRTA